MFSRHFRENTWNSGVGGAEQPQPEQRAVTKQGKINTHREEQKSISVYVNNTALVIQMIKNVGFSTKTTGKFTNKSNKN